MRSMCRGPWWPGLAIAAAVLSACGSNVRQFGTGGGSATSSSSSTSATSSATSATSSATGSTSSSSSGGSALCVLGSSKVGDCVVGP